MVYTNDTLKKAIDEISSKNVRCYSHNESKENWGIITDGDVRRILSKYKDPLSQKLVLL